MKLIKKPSQVKEVNLHNIFRPQLFAIILAEQRTWKPVIKSQSYKAKFIPNKTKFVQNYLQFFFQDISKPTKMGLTKRTEEYL